MKIKSVFSIFTGIISLALVFGTMALSCSLGDDDPTSVTTPYLTYSAEDTDLVTVFKDQNPTSAFRTVANGKIETGMLYEIYQDGDMISHGTITVTGTTITFTSVNGGSSFSADISSDSITFTSDITTDEGGALTVTGEDLGKEEQTDAPNPFVGTWYSDRGGTVIVTETTWRYSNIWGYSDNGTYTYIGNTATYYFAGDDYPNVTRIIDGVFHTQGETFSR
jgi:hypothetical protein